jgi:hypothetical protein
MAGRLADATDTRNAIALYNDPTVAAGRRTLWPNESTTAGLDLKGKRLWVSVTSNQLRLGLTTKIAPLSFVLPGERVDTKIDEWLTDYIGPVSGLNPSQNETAHRECLRAWFAATRLEHPAPWRIAGIVPPNWPATFRTMYASLVAPTITALPSAYLGLVDHRGGSLIWGDVHTLRTP